MFVPDASNGGKVFACCTEANAACRCDGVLEMNRFDCRLMQDWQSHCTPSFRIAEVGRDGTSLCFMIDDGWRGVCLRKDFVRMLKAARVLESVGAFPLLRARALLAARLLHQSQQQDIETRI